MIIILFILEFICSFSSMCTFLGRRRGAKGVVCECFQNVGLGTEAAVRRNLSIPRDYIGHPVSVEVCLYADIC